MNTKKLLIGFVTTFVVTLVFCAIVTYLWNLTFHGVAVIDWETSFRFAIIFGILFTWMKVWENVAIKMSKNKKYVEIPADFVEMAEKAGYDVDELVQNLMKMWMGVTNEAHQAGVEYRDASECGDPYLCKIYDEMNFLAKKYTEAKFLYSLEKVREQKYLGKI